MPHEEPPNEQAAQRSTGDEESKGQERRKEAPSYDTSKENYAGIASGGREGEEGLQAAKDFAEMIVDTVREGLLILDLDLRVVAANESFYMTFEAQPEETLGRLVYELDHQQWDLPALHDLLEDILPEKKVMNDFVVEHEFVGIGLRYMLLNARQLDDHQLILLAIEDVTERRKTERELQRLTDELEARVEERTRQVRKLASTLTMAEQEERRRISQILHDDLQQQLYGISMKISFIQGHAEADRKEELLAEVEEAEEWLSQCVKITRDLTVDLSPPILKSEGLTGTLEWLQSQMKELHGLEVEIEADGPLKTPEEDLRVLLFQIVRELLFNVAKHAGANRATVEVRRVNHHVEIIVTDEGQGFDVEAAEAQSDEEGGFGLFSVRERLGLFGGEMHIDAERGKGTQVTLSVPLQLE